MRLAYAPTLILVASCLARADGPGQRSWIAPAPQALAQAQQPQQQPLEQLPQPSPVPRPLPPLEDCFPRPTNPLKELLQQLGKEREALEAAHEAAARDLDDGVAINTTANAMLRLRVKQLLAKLAQQRAVTQETAAPQPKQPFTPSPPQTQSPRPDKPPVSPPPPLLPKQPKSPANALPQPVDPLAVAHALYRAGSYDAALQAFRIINLRGMRAEQRAPIQYLMASCLRKQGKIDDALALYRDVANSKGDEQVAACAQWQIANLRWQRETLDRLAEIKQRRQALEK